MINSDAFVPFQPQPVIGPIWHCLKCDAPIRETVFDANNGTCDECGPLKGPPMPVRADVKEIA